MTDRTVCLTGCGAPGTVGTLWSLAQNLENESIRTVGTDVRARQVGRYTCDSFHRVPSADQDDFLDTLVSVCDREDVDVLLPQVTAELPVLASATDRFEAVGTSVAVSSAPAIERANDKATLIDRCEDLGVPTPESTVVESRVGLEEAAARLGYPDRPIVVKPPVANGQRGFRIVSENWDRKRAFYEDKPDGTKTTMAQLQGILGETFPALLVSEYLPGAEFSVDAFRAAGESVVVPRSRDRIRSGISFQNTVQKNETLIDHCRRLADAIDLEYAFGFQFKRAVDGTFKILECNPRVQGSMVASTLAGSNLVYAAVEAAAGDPVSVSEPAWGTEFDRYWGGIGTRETRRVGNIGEGV